MPANAKTLEKDPSEAPNEEARQYAAWGVVVQTNRVRAAHVANGVMQLLRLAPQVPAWPSGAAPDDALGLYVAALKKALKERELGPALSPEATAFCVVKNKQGPLLLESPTPGEPSFVQKGREHAGAILDPAGPLVVAGKAGHLKASAHRLLADVLNADGKVMASGGSDPTTTGLGFAGFSDTHTLKGMHAATFLGLLGATEGGRAALSRLHRAAAGGDESKDAGPHAHLASLLGLSLESRWPSLSADDFRGIYPVPAGDAWGAYASVVGESAANITAWQERGATQAETLMSVVDIALLALSSWMLRWRRDPSTSQRLLLVVCSMNHTAALHQSIMRAQESLRVAGASLEDEAEEAKLIKRKQKKGKTSGAPPDENVYSPSTHAINLASAGGWLFPLDGRGGARRYLCPGPRQLVTLVHSLLPPAVAVPWPEFARRAERLGLALGGTDEATTEKSLAIGGVAATLREAARTNQERLITLGLARRESDNVVIVDGGAV